MEKWLPKVPEPPQGVEIVTDRWGEAGVIVVVPKLVDPVPADSRTTPVMTAHGVRLDLPPALTYTLGIG